MVSPAQAFAALDRTVDDSIVARLRSAGYQGVTASHGRVFAALDPGGTRVTELAARAGMTRQAMTDIVDLLERHGYMHRKPDPNDRRAALIRLTPRGKSAVKLASAVVVEMEEQWRELLGPRAFDAFQKSLDSLVTAVR